MRREIEINRQLKELTERLEAANVRLKELDQAKTEFLSIASHQLRTPLSAIRGYASMIAEGDYGKITKAVAEPLGRIVESGRLMASSIEDYLNVSRIEQGRMKYDMQAVDLSEVARTVVVELTPDARRRNLELSVHADAPLPVTADMGKIKQVVSNLVDNALKYTTEGSIHVTAERAENNARVTVTDSGVGFTKEDAQTLFSKFVRGRNANKVNTSGTGLGLYVARLIVEAHKGTLRAESDGPGKGARFILELPLR